MPFPNDILLIIAVISVYLDRAVNNRASISRAKRRILILYRVVIMAPVLREVPDRRSIFYRNVIVKNTRLRRNTAGGVNYRYLWTSVRMVAIVASKTDGIREN